MLFSEPIFLFLFLPVVLLFYAALPQRCRNLWLTVSSLVFYAWGELRFVPVLLLSVALNYYFALWIDARRGTRQAFWILTLGVISDMSLLVYFKYANFLFDNFNIAMARLHLGPFQLQFNNLVMPLGISFFTFHKISYKVDVFRGRAAAKRNPLDLALYILLFPQLIAGPIVRYNEISEQISVSARVLKLERFAGGISIFIIGLAKKMLIANTVAMPTDRIFAIPSDQLTAPVAWLGLLCYSLQIYFDFSGYSDMAIGLARIFGFNFPSNFNYPYFADSVTEFWHRWHMSLSRWFRDYVYIPLGGNRVPRWRLYANLFTVFFLCGLWHGAARTFVVWGLFHGLFLVLERAFLGRWLEKLPRVLRHTYLIVIVMTGWVFFRSESLHYAAFYLKALLGLNHADPRIYYPALYLNRLVLLSIAIGIVGSTPLLPALHEFFRRRYVGQEHEELPTAQRFDQTIYLLRFAGLSICFLLAALSVVGSTYNPFIYFRF